MDRTFHAELAKIRDNLVLMAEKAMHNTRRAMEAFEKRDLSICEEVLTLDKEIDDLELLIDQASIRYMTLFQPVSADMRLIAVAIKTSHDIERIGDEATSIAKRVSRIISGEVNGKAVPDNLISIPAAADMALTMLKEAIDAFVEEDVEQCVAIIRQDKQVDSMNRRNFEGFTEMISAGSFDTEILLELLFVSKSIERIADHATNIAEEVIYLLSGKEVRHMGIKKGAVSPTEL